MIGSIDPDSQAAARAIVGDLFGPPADKPAPPIKPAGHGLHVPTEGRVQPRRPYRPNPLRSLLRGYDVYDE